MAFLEPLIYIGQQSNGGLMKKIKSAFTGRIITVSYENANDECLLPEIFLYETLYSLKIEVNSFLKANQAFKFTIELHAIYTKPNVMHFENNQLETNIFRSDMKDVYWLEDFENEFRNQVKCIIRKSEEFQSKESGWTLIQLVKVDFKFNKYQPFKGSGYIPLPKPLALKKACVNILNKDEFCFKWVVIAAVSCLERNINRPSSYNVNIFSEMIECNGYILNFKGLNFPLDIKNIFIFEENNPMISINVLGFDKENDLVIGPYYKARKKRAKHINLLFFEETIGQKTIGHYVWIKSMSRLVRNQLTLCHSKIRVCDICLQNISGGNIEKHKNCAEDNEIVVEENNSVLEFKNCVKTINVPFVAYLKYACISENVNGCNPISYIFTYFIKCSYDNNLNKWRSFKGLDAPKLFAKSLIDDAKHFYNNYSKKFAPKIPMTDEENSKYHQDSSCCICKKKNFGEKVKLHCRFSGRYKGNAHLACSLNYRAPKKFPVFMQNLTHNDYVLLIKLFSDIDEDPINVRPLSESNVSFTKDIRLVGEKLELRFLNVLFFMPYSLDYLVQHMPREDFKVLKLTYPDNENKFSLVLRKCIFPHNYINSVEKLAETSLPSIDYFNNTLINKECSPGDYAHAKIVWEEFQCKTLDDYLMLCIMTDVILLTDVFEKFRSVCKNAYNLDPCNYYSASEFSWDAMFKITDIKLKLLTDGSMISFVKKGIREAISKCFQTRSVANNKYLSDYNDKLPSKYLMYFHANDLYGRVMSESLPDGNFEWESDIEHFSLDSIPNDSKTGYILEVDLEYPKGVHETHTAFPFCIQNIISPESDEKNSIDLNNYVIYYKNLQQCLKHGLKLKKINRILKFSQSDWLKNYITLNKTCKANAKNSFEVNVFKVMNDELYKKIMEKSRQKIKILQRWETDGNKLGARAFTIRPQFSSLSIIDENMVALQFNVNICQYMPIYLGFVISELARLKMYSFHYEYMIPKYESKFQLNYIDRDSLIYTITTNDLYQDITNEICLMIHNELIGNAVNNKHLSFKTLGMMKDATDGGVIKEFIGLRPKLYSLKTEVVRETNDVNFCNYTSLSDYKNLLCNKKIYCDNIKSFKLKLFQRYTKLFNELSITYLDDNTCNEINKCEAMDFE